MPRREAFISLIQRSLRQQRINVFRFSKFCYAKSSIGGIAMNKIKLSRFLMLCFFSIVCSSQSFATLLAENPFCKADPDCPYIKKVFVDVLPPWNHQLIESSSDVSKEGFSLVYQAVEKVFDKWNKIAGRKKYELVRFGTEKIPNFEQEKNMIRKVSMKMRFY
jgi:hypothetical protein